MSNELLPCPFCGGEADQVLTDYEQVQVEEVRCRDCWATVGGATEAAAILAWNHRAPIPAPSTRMADVRLGAERIEALREALRQIAHGETTCNIPGATDYEKCDAIATRALADDNDAATVTLPAIQKNERSTDAFQCPSCGAAIKAPPRSNEKTLRRYGWHDESCPDYPTRTRPIGLCNCGFLSALASKESDRG